MAVVQLATSQGVNDHRLSRDEARFRVGDVSTGGTLGVRALPTLSDRPLMPPSASLLP